MTYNVFGGTLNLAQSIYGVIKDGLGLCWRAPLAMGIE